MTEVYVVETAQHANSPYEEVYIVGVYRDFDTALNAAKATTGVPDGVGVTHYTTRYVYVQYGNSPWASVTTCGVE